MVGGCVDHIDVRKFLSRTLRLRSCETVHEDVPRLSSILPSTIQKLSLLVDDMDEQSKALDSLFSGIALDNLEKLLHLKEVVICTKSKESGSGRKARETHETSDGGQDDSVGSCGSRLEHRVNNRSRRAVYKLLRILTMEKRFGVSGLVSRCQICHDHWGCSWWSCKAIFHQEFLCSIRSGIYILNSQNVHYLCIKLSAKSLQRILPEFCPSLKYRLSW
jgi:hypothetical protein